MQKIQDITHHDLFLRALWEGVLVSRPFRVAAFAYIRKIVDIANNPPASNNGTPQSPAPVSLLSSDSGISGDDIQSSISGNNIHEDISPGHAMVVGNAINNVIAANALVSSLKDKQVMVLRGVLEVLCAFFTLDSRFVSFDVNILMCTAFAYSSLASLVLLLDASRRSKIRKL